MVSTHLKNISQIGSFPQVGVKIKNIGNHHLVYHIDQYWQISTTIDYSVDTSFCWDKPDCLKYCQEKHLTKHTLSWHNKPRRILFCWHVAWWISLASALASAQSCRTWWIGTNGIWGWSMNGDGIWVQSSNWLKPLFPGCLFFGHQQDCDTMFRFGDPRLNLHLPLLERGTTRVIRLNYSCEMRLIVFSWCPS